MSYKAFLNLAVGVCFLVNHNQAYAYGSQRVGDTANATAAFADSFADNQVSVNAVATWSELKQIVGSSLELAQNRKFIKQFIKSRGVDSRSMLQAALKTGDTSLAQLNEIAQTGGVRVADGGLIIAGIILFTLIASFVYIESESDARQNLKMTPEEYRQYRQDGRAGDCETGAGPGPNKC